MKTYSIYTDLKISKLSRNNYNQQRSTWQETKKIFLCNEPGIKMHDHVSNSELRHISALDLFQNLFRNSQSRVDFSSFSSVATFLSILGKTIAHTIIWLHTTLTKKRKSKTTWNMTCFTSIKKAITLFLYDACILRCTINIYLFMCYFPLFLFSHVRKLYEQNGMCYRLIRVPTI